MSKGKAITIGQALDRTEELMSVLGYEARFGGSLRRRYESEADKDITINDVDVVVPRAVDVDEVKHLGTILASGKKKIRIVLPMPDVTYDEDDEIKGLQVDIQMCEPDEFGACLLYLTGPYDFNIQMRSYAKSEGLKLNEKGLWLGDDLVAGRTERGIFKALKLPWTRAAAREKLKTFSGVAAWQMTVPSSRKGKDPYTVTLQGDGKWHCTCQGWHWSKKSPKTCRHVEKVAKPAHAAA